MSWVTNALSVVVLGVMGFRLASGVRVAKSSSGRALIRTVWHRIGWRHIWPIPVVLTAVVITATLLIQIPGLRWGWWQAIGGEGNPVFGSSEATAGTWWETAIPLVFITMLMLALPLFANAEERMFRRDAEHWSTSRRAYKIVSFGLVHALVGIPIGAAIALSWGGLYFMIVYLRQFRVNQSATEATLEATAAHTAYNAVIISIVVIGVALGAVIS